MKKFCAKSKSIFNRKSNFGYFTRYAHDCDLSSQSEINKCIPGNTCWSSVKRFWYRMVCVSDKRPCVLRVLRSQYAVVREQHRQIMKYKYSIHPYSDFRLLWELMVSVICLLSLITFPLSYAFPDSIRFLELRIAFVVLLVSDILINFCTGYYSEDRKEVIFTFKYVAWHYIKTFLIFDIVSSVDGFTRDIVVDAVLFCAKMFRLFTLVRYTRKISNVLGVPFGIYTVAFLMLTFFLLPNFLGCLILFFFDNYRSKSYPGYDRYENSTQYQIYVDIYYHGCIIMVLAGYGNREPASNYEAFLVTICWYVCFGVSIYFRGVLLEMITCRTSSRHKYVQMVLQLKEYMRYKQMSRHLQRRLINYYEFRFQRRFFLEKEILNAVSGQLRQEIALHSCRKLVENVTFFHQLPTNQLVRIVSCLKSEIFLTNDVIIMSESQGHEMYFISTGTVAVYTISGQEVCHLEDGAHFGEIALLHESKKRIASVVAVETSELYSLTRNDFIRAIHPYPDLMDEIQRIAADRMEITTTLNEQHKREIDSKRNQSKDH